MKVVLPEKNQIKKRQLLLYILIMIICIICIVIAFYVQFFGGTLLNSEGKLGKKTQGQEEQLKAEFDKLFYNVIEENEEINQYKKADNSKSLVYTDVEKKESKLNSYDIELHIPQINVDNDIIKGYNEEIKEIFVSKAESVLKSENKNIIYTVEYVANVQDGILSLMIRSNLKEGSNAQRVIIQTYNYDLRHNKEITLEEVLNLEGIDNNQIQTKIREEIKKEQKKVQELKNLGYNIYSRDSSSDVYNLDNSTEYYFTENTIYVIYAYGNDKNTSEMDLIVI